MTLLALLASVLALAGPPPVARYVDDRFGPVLATPKQQALYTWDAERDLRIHCTGACARLWPPLIVRFRSSVPPHIRGIGGTLGTIRRPDGRLQVTFNRRPVYTYVHEGPRQVLCDNVDGWFVVRLS
jgi:predicted lipoprotein with Yx(FWY)xxD motif